MDTDAQFVNHRNPGGLTPLHLAALYGQREVAEYLIGKGADLNAVARHSGTPLDVAFEAGQHTCVAWLQPRGAQFTPLRFAITPLSRHTRRVTIPWGMMINTVVFSGSDGAIVVDSGFSARAVEALRNVIAESSKLGVQHVINSHGHGDHVAGNALSPSPASALSAASLAAGAGGSSMIRGGQPIKGRTGRTLPAP